MGKLVLLETSNSEIKKYWEIKLDGTDFITIGMITSYDSSFVRSKSDDQIVSCLTNDVKSLLKAIYDTSKHNNFLTTASNNYIYEQILTINFDINDCNQNNKNKSELTNVNKKLFKTPNMSSGHTVNTEVVLLPKKKIRAYY